MAISWTRLVKSRDVEDVSEWVPKINDQRAELELASGVLALWALGERGLWEPFQRKIKDNNKESWCFQGIVPLGTSSVAHVRRSERERSPPAKGPGAW